MKKHLIALLAAAGLVAPLTGSAAEPKTTTTVTTCVVSGEKLGEMGKPYVYKYEGREIQLCCKSCVKKFNKDPETYLKKWDAAQKGS